MAEIIQHPNTIWRREEFISSSSSGAVTVSSPEGDQLTVERALFLLEAAKIDLLKAAEVM